MSTAGNMTEHIVGFQLSSLHEMPSWETWEEYIIDVAEEGFLTLLFFVVTYVIGRWFHMQHLAERPKGALYRSGCVSRRLVRGSTAAERVPATRENAPSCPETDAGTCDGQSLAFAPSPDGTAPSHPDAPFSQALLPSAGEARLADASCAPRSRKSLAPAAGASSPNGKHGAEPSPEGAAAARQARQVLASLRLCAARRDYQEGLRIYDAAAGCIEAAPSGCARTWSLLLHCAVEAGAFQRCEHFYEQLCSLCTPSTDDFVNMVRCYASRKDFGRLTDLVRGLRTKGWGPDVFARNRALAACCVSRATTASDLSIAEHLLEVLPDVPMDIIAYNTMIKGYASVGLTAKCFGVYKTLLESGMTPSEKTYGILLDACIGAKDVEAGRRVFADLKASGLQPNVVHCTAYIKCLVSSGLLQEAQSFLEEMESNPAIIPDLVTFSTLVKAFAEKGHLADSLRIVDRMIQQGVQPDAMMFNTLLTGCCARPMATAQIMEVLAHLLEQGLQPSTATLSILVKAFALSEAWQEALVMLQTANVRFGLEPELWLFAQLAQASVHRQRGDIVLRAFLSMLIAAASRGEAVEKSLSSRMQRLCTSCGSGAHGSRLHQAVVGAKGPLSPSDVDQLASDVAAALQAN